MSDAITQCRFAIAEVWSYLDPGQAINELFKDVTFLAFKFPKWPKTQREKNPQRSGLRCAIIGRVWSRAWSNRARLLRLK